MASTTGKKEKPSQKAIPGGKEPTFEKVRAMLRETDRIIRENAKQQKETDRIVKKVTARRKETERQMKESAERHAEQHVEHQKETERQMKESAERHDRQMKENAEQLDLQMKESAEMFDWQMQENAERLDWQIREIDRQLGKFGGNFGSHFDGMTGYMVAPNVVLTNLVLSNLVLSNMVIKFRELGFVFEKTYKDTTIYDKTNNIFTEVAITFENDDKVMLVEFKSKPKTEDITGHIERMEKFRSHANLHGDKRKYLGAVAGMVFNDKEKTLAMKSGFYVIELSGETFIITAPEGVYSN
jgi:flagellar biosynthesis GTPase FlhF